MLYRLIRAASCACALSAFSALPATAATLGFAGAFWDTGTFRTVDEAVAHAGANAPDATFVSSAIDYPRGARNVVRSGRTSLAAYLADDANTLSGGGDLRLTGSVFRFSGVLDLVPGTTTFTVGSDDGFRLILGGVVAAEQVRPRGFRETEITTSVGGRTEFVLYYFENRGRTGVEFRANDRIVDASLAATPVPLPGSAGLALTGLALLAIGGRARSRKR